MSKSKKGFTFSDTIRCYNECTKYAPDALIKMGFTKKEIDRIDIRVICRKLCIDMSEVKEYLRENSNE